MAQTINRPGAQAPIVNPSKGQAPWPITFYRSAIGKKWVMAVTGLGLLGFVLAHMVGNLKMYLGREDIDAYAHALKTLLHPIMPNEVVLWIFRIALFTMLVLHVHAAATLTILNRKARPVGYQSPRDYIAVSFASKSMRYTGAILFLYLIFHILDLTIGTTNPDFVAGNVYDNLVASMSRWPVAIVYILANIAIAIHLFHGIWSAFQSLGLNSPRYNAARRYAALGISALILIGNVSFPIMILAGVVS
jgi:succinate dehydrogenase / fumarate reductase cytochrome b subunit